MRNRSRTLKVAALVLAVIGGLLTASLTSAQATASAAGGCPGVIDRDDLCR